MISSTVRAFNDPDAFHKAIRDAQAEGVITRRGNFQAELASIRFDRISIHRSTERLSRLAYSVVNSNLLGVILQHMRIRKYTSMDSNWRTATSLYFVQVQKGTTGLLPLANGVLSC